ncbi:hypothetical protein G7Y79_00036g072140 [Physcia stellaris]|nr:hypothetical protein G7Y79_00036g072140 [Physcia stellaris]
MIPVLAYEALTLFLLVLLRILSPVVATPANPSLRPAIALVPAAWHSPIHYREYTNQLRFLGYQIITQRLRSCDNANPEAQSVGLDAVFIRRNLLSPPINDGRDVVLIMHSYSGGPGAAAAKSLSKAERHAAGQPGGIIRLVFISSFVAKEGQTLSDGQLGVRNGNEMFYNDVTGPLADFAVAELRNQSRRTAETPCGPPAWSDWVYDARRAFVHCTLDNAIPLAAQDAMLQQSSSPEVHQGILKDISSSIIAYYFQLLLRGGNTLHRIPDAKSNRAPITAIKFTLGGSFELDMVRFLT